MEIYLQKGLPEAARAIRQEVFVEEQGFQREFDDIDPAATHAVLFLNAKAAATGRTFPKEGERETYLIGRVAVLKEFRRRGLGKHILEALEQAAREAGARQIELSAQMQAKGFYEKLGYEAGGEIYQDEFCPHQTMRKKL